MSQAVLARTDRGGLIQWGAIATAAAGATAMLEVLSPLDGRPGSALSLLFLILLVVGLVAIHLLQDHAYGRPTSVAMYALIAGSVLQAGNAVGGILGTQALQPLDDIGSLLLLVGFLAYGGSTLRGRVLPWWCGAIFMTGFLGWVAFAIAMGDTGAIIGGLWLGGLWIALGAAVRHHCKTASPTRSH